MDPLDLLPKVEKFLSETGMTPTEFGRLAMRDPVLVNDLRAGRELRRKSRERVLMFIAQFRKAA